MTQRSLTEWLQWLEQLHPRKWDLGLERVGSVAARMGVLEHEGTLFLVAGTNGKGSTVAYLEALARAHGYRTGSSTSPHLLRFNERIQLDGRDVADDLICASFERIDAARGDTSLTYFEFGALAALDIFRSKRPEVIVLEIGLGGRLDAMNIVDPDVSVVTSIDLDHQAWLGQDRETIGREKAAIFRARAPAVIGDPDPPASVLEYARSVNAQAVVRDREFRVVDASGEWTFEAVRPAGEVLRLAGLPRPRLHLDNAAAALAAWVHSGLRVDPPTVAHVVGATELEGRCRVVCEAPTVLVDVAHNPHAAANLAARLQNSACSGRTIAVIGMLKDKDCESFSARLAPWVETWHVAGLEGDRGQSGTELQARLKPQRGSNVRTYATVDGAFLDALQYAGEQDRIVVTGSFLTVAAALEILRERGPRSLG